MPRRLRGTVLALFWIVSSALGAGNFSKEELQTARKLDNVNRNDLIKARIKKLKNEVQETTQKEHLKLKKRALKVDTIIIRGGTVLQGKISELTDKYVEFSPLYGIGTIRIHYKNIERITTEHKYHIFYNGKETTGQIVSIKDHAFLIIQHDGIKEYVKIANIDRFILSVKENDTLENRLRNRFPYTRSSIDIGIERETGVKYNRKLTFDYHLTRRKVRHREILDLHYAYETTTTSLPQGEVKSLDKKDLHITAEENILIDPQQFWFAQLGYDFDQPRKIRYRLYPAVGYGYRFLFGPETWLQFKTGAGYVYESFYPYATQNFDQHMNNHDYSAAFIGIRAKNHFYNLWLFKELILLGNIFYMPSLTYPSHDWLSRSTFTIEVPINTMLSLKWVYRIINDDNPVPEVGNNKTTTDLYFSIRY